MYAIKQAQLLSGALPLADITIYYMDIRTFGKGYEQFYTNAKAMGIEFVKGKVSKITEDDNHNPSVHLEMVDETPRLLTNAHDLVVLSVGMIPRYDPQPMYGVSIAEDGFILSPATNRSPTLTNQAGVFATGTALGPMDIVDSIMMASACASETAAYLRGKGYRRRSPSSKTQLEEERLHA
jgi:heterodisulfide reductase subunit A